VIRKVVQGLQAFNRRHPWSHNDHFHPWILRRLPKRRARALDVGCGRGGLLALLAERFGAAHGTDIDWEMRRATAERCASFNNVTVGAEQLEELDVRYDLITMVAVLHHLDPTTALTQVRRLLAPQGRLLVVGLAPPVTMRDQLVDVASALANPVMGIIKHPRPHRQLDEPPFPMREPDVSFDQLRVLAGQILPGAVMRRRLFFRYTLAWTQKADASTLVAAELSGLQENFRLKWGSKHA
jgi:SAM-dependent methyltransferase